MKIAINSSIFDSLPELSVYGLSVYGIDQKPLQGFSLAEMTAKIKIDDLLATELLSLWKNFHKENNSYKKARTSIEYLYKKNITDGLKSINPLVDAYNYASLKNMSPLGGEDLDKITSDMILCRSEGSENFTPIFSNAEENPNVGELIWKLNSDDVVCRSLNWIESDKFKIDDLSKNIIFISESPDGRFPKGNSALVELENIINRFCQNVQFEFFELNIKNKSFELSCPTAKIP